MQEQLDKDAAMKKLMAMQMNDCEMKVTPVDMVNKPPHYNNGNVECIDAIESALTPEEFRGYCKGNALKYIWREKLKNGKEDIEKALWYLKRMVR